MNPPIDTWSLGLDVTLIQMTNDWNIVFVSSGCYGEVEGPTNGKAWVLTFFSFSTFPVDTKYS